MQTRPAFAACFSLVLLLLTHTTAAGDFRGWQGIRVIEQDGNPSILRAGDIDQDGRQELIAVNSRYSRLDIYHWLPEEDRTELQRFEDDRPNDLPMAREVRREELQLEHLPQDVVLKDLDGDDRPELIILVAPPNRVLVYAHRDNGGEAAWHQRYRVDLLEGDIPSHRQAMLVREVDEEKTEVLVSCADGIQRLDLHPQGRAAWLAPREKRSRADWWLADLDGDGYDDLVEQTRQSDQAVRWYRCSREGDLVPAQVLFDRATSGAEVLRAGSAAELVLMDGAAQGLIRRYKLGAGDASPVGVRQPLPLVGGKNAAWCGMQLGCRHALVVADPNRPRLLTYPMETDGWGAEEQFPSVGGVQVIVAPVAKPGTLLIWAKDAADLQISRWNSERLTYPEPWPPSGEIKEDGRKILALQQVGSTTCWVQKAGDHLDLYRWSPGQEEPSKLRFSSVAGKADQALWIGGKRLLVKDALARGLRLVTIRDGKAVDSNPSHLERAGLREFKLLPVGDEFRLARFTDGVLQWLDADLQAYDQIMLPEGVEMADYVAEGADRGWALQSDAPYLHRLKADSSGIVQAAERIKVADGTSLVQDPFLGLFLVHHDRIMLLKEGAPRELDLVGVIDGRVGRAGGVRETRFHRIGTTDLDGDGCDELILFDDMEHRLSALACADGELVPQISWPVFDDKIYPYSAEMANLVQEPRAICGLEFDGDKERDLALLCHDRLLIYLGREAQ